MTWDYEGIGDGYWAVKHGNREVFVTDSEADAKSAVEAQAIVQRLYDFGVNDYLPDWLLERLADHLGLDEKRRNKDFRIRR
ncbi:hypothetical protein [Tsukamurella paurometabola]|uniref:Uncharacterized protein n=1 Tax=Tsukamurella paurometabola TaxID=2061 RepID=A0ABS5NEH7_TSUPA|nr:hypothetical protein [Tsukamurella paurometabola]MBS4102430.1 hypothetical protein [Tsukamurella paurometabola]